MSISVRGAGSWLLLGIAAVAAGLASVRPVVGYVADRAATHNGPWRTSISTGNAEANPYTRAAVALSGLYALSSREAIYYTAFEDSAAQPLDGRCTYRVQGRPLPARWWSLTLYGADDYLVANSAGVYSRHAGNLALEPDGAYEIQVGSREQPGNWLPSPASGSFSLTLRLYNPDATVVASPASVAMPEIVRGACR